MTEREGSIKLAESNDNEVEYFMMVDDHFVDLVDDVVKSLVLSHFTVVTDKKIQ